MYRYNTIIGIRWNIFSDVKKVHTFGRAQYHVLARPFFIIASTSNKQLCSSIWHGLWMPPSGNLERESIHVFIDWPNTSHFAYTSPEKSRTSNIPGMAKMAIRPLYKNALSWNQSGISFDTSLSSLDDGVRHRLWRWWTNSSLLSLSWLLAELVSKGSVSKSDSSSSEVALSDECVSGRRLIVCSSSTTKASRCPLRIQEKCNQGCLRAS